MSLVIIAEADLVIDTTPAGLLGEGGFGIVRRASWRGAPVAAKSLQLAAAEVGEGPLRAFNREIEVLARLRHPNVVPVFGVCHHADGRTTLVEELATGGTLSRRIHPRIVGGAAGAAATPARMSTGELASVGLDIARALAYAHAAGVTHNDIKSVNVLFNGAGAAMLADFGLARRVRSALPNTFANILGSSSGSGGGMLGTIQWAAPENFDDESHNHGQPPGDIYSFGLVLYEMSAGVEPWEGRNIAQIVGAVTGGRRPALSADTDARVRALVERCWAQDPAARPQAAALVAELAQLSQGVQPGPSPAAAAAAAAEAERRRAEAAEAEARAQRTRAEAEAQRAGAMKAEMAALRLRAEVAEARAAAVVLSSNRLSGGGGSGGVNAAAFSAAAGPSKLKKEKALPAEGDEEELEEVDNGREDDLKRLFGVLAPSSFVMDEWKRTYSNSKSDFYAAMPWFWKHLDKAGYSVWTQSYKYNADNKVDWKTSNTVGGFMQRCEGVRKYAFGMMAVLGEAAPYEIIGVWLIRGKSMAPMLEANPDAEYYDWAEVNVEDAAARKHVADVWCHVYPGSLTGKDLYDSKVFK